MEREMRQENTIRENREMFAQALISAMDRRGLSQCRLSNDICRSRNGVHNWTAGRQMPDVEQFGKLLEILKPDEIERQQLVEPWSSNFMLRRRKYSRPTRVRRSEKRIIHISSLEQLLAKEKIREGFSQACVARMAKVSRQRVHQIKDEYNIPVPLNVDGVRFILNKLNVKIVDRKV